MRVLVRLSVMHSESLLLHKPDGFLLLYGEGEDDTVCLLLSVLDCRVQRHGKWRFHKTSGNYDETCLGEM